jgi:hypothetical protein
LTRALISGNDPELEDFVPEEERKTEEPADLLQVEQTLLF